MELFKHTLFINLEHRSDRLEHVKEELKKIGVEGERVNAVKLAQGAIGCTMSHIKCIELAKTRNWPHVFICEDDITFTNPSLFLENIKKFHENKDIIWDVLIIGGNNVPPYQKVQPYCARVLNCQTTTGYIVKSDFYDVLIDNFKEGVQKLMKNPANKREFAIDMYWKRLQMQYYWYMIMPATVTQYENYSDIEDRNMSYDRLLLDTDKEWYTKQQKAMKMQL
jgi:GR25 family glycosyltransferase involved in LPS biosynthesis